MKGSLQTFVSIGLLFRKGANSKGRLRTKVLNRMTGSEVFRRTAGGAIGKRTMIVAVLALFLKVGIVAVYFSCMGIRIE